MKRFTRVLGLLSLTPLTTAACGDAIEWEPSAKSGALRTASETSTCGLREGCSEDPVRDEDGSQETEGDDGDEREEPSATTPGVFDMPVKPLIAMPPVPSGTPNQVANKSAALKEVDVVHVGGTDATTKPLFVSVAGTGSVGVLSSFRSANVSDAPKHLHDGPKLLGHNHQLRTLRANESARSSYELVVSARIRNQALWLNTWRVHPDGQLELLHGLGYGPSLGAAVEDYTLAHRPLPSPGAKRFQLVTPVVHDGGTLRVVSWEIDGQSGQITGKQHSSDVAGESHAAGRLSAALVPGDGSVEPHYVVARRVKNDALNHTLWNVESSGAANLLSSTTTGRDIRLANALTQSIRDVAVAAVGPTGHLAATNRSSTGALRMTVWEDSNCGQNGCQFRPSYISDDARDIDAAPKIQQGGAFQPSPGTQNVMLRDPAHGVDLFTQNPDVVQAIASVRKVMVTVVALDAVAAGEVSLDDQVEISAAAANVNNFQASVMGLVQGEKISLRNLLYGNMMVSAGDATWAISEHVAGSIANMVTRMNNKANQLGMTNTLHCQEGSVFSSVAYSTARDQVRLWESVHDDPEFLHFAGRASQEVCGTLPGNVELCHPVNPPQNPMTKNMTLYPNLDGYKPGGGGGTCSFLPQYSGVSSCLPGGCVAAQTTRIGRPLIAVELQPNSSLFSATPWTDANRQFDFGFAQIFTPEFLGDSGAQGGAVKDFALDTVSDLHSLTATLTQDGALTLCNWATDLQAGSIEKTVCTTRNFVGLGTSARSLSPRALDLVRVGTLFADGDYLLGRHEDGKLVLRLWRVGQRG